MTFRPPPSVLPAALFLLSLLLALAAPARAAELLVPMDRTQTNHLKAYGLAYESLTKGHTARWLLNYRGGSFLVADTPDLRGRAQAMNVLAQPIDAARIAAILKTVEDSNMDVVLLEKAPKVAVYKPHDTRPWDDAVTMALEYAEIPFTNLWDPEVLAGDLSKYDWLHLHHEDFTGQYGKFWASYQNAPWYVKQVERYKRLAAEAGHPTVAAHKLAVAQAIRAYVKKGGFLFAMCSACDSMDVALAAEGIDIIPPEIDGTPMDPDAQARLDFSQCLAFENFTLVPSPYIYEYSDIDVDPQRYSVGSDRGDFVLFEFSAKLDRSPTILTQCHENNVKGFMGQTTGFRARTLKKNVITLARMNEEDVKYIYGSYGEGNFTFYGGHDPEDFAHLVGEAPTNLASHPNSPGYRLILNNILFPAVKKQKLKT